ncbi:hypothetical protein HOLleu_10628 [Holothuria leucospilota]|uniref:Uncharacterized protein n=1 Tax=Holothuria leucospilota TaxID=206669 RepID=A0A9Q1HFW4_HOLLE|nr:hypothetical protein HOLleu_10628 [Holothuria leucospilota]
MKTVNYSFTLATNKISFADKNRLLFQLQYVKMFSTRLVLLLVLFGAVAIIETASSPLEESSDEEELDLSERGLLDRFCEHRLNRHPKRGLPGDEPNDEDIDELVARVAKLNPGSRSWSKIWHKVKSHAGKMAKFALHAAEHVGK